MARKKIDQKGLAELRRLAEEQIEKQGASASPFTDGSRDRLIQELQTHQIELEMQNEELRRLRDEAEALAGKYQDVYDFAPVGYFTLSPEGTILQANLMGALLLGLARARLIGQRLANLVSSGSAPVFDAFFEKAFLSETPPPCEVEIVRHGNPPLLAQLEARTSSDGRECRLAMIDVTEKRKAEQGLRLYQILASQIRDIILFTDGETGHIIEANIAAEEAYGYTKAELCGLTIHELHAGGATEPAPAQAIPGEHCSVLFETLHRRRDGSVFPVEVSSRWEEVSGNSMLISLIRDITVRRTGERALADRTGELERTNVELESFSYSVSHDLRAPLRTIDGYARMILRRHAGQFDAETLAQFSEIRKGARKMGQLIDDLLIFSRLGRLAPSLANLDMAELVRDRWQAQLQANPDRQMTLRIGKLPPAQGDRTLVRQVLENLLTNAVKFTRRQESAEIEVGGYPEGGETVYFVRDNGAGFDMAYHDKLFGVFQRLHSDEEYEGTGIGLALVKRIVQRHGGRVWAEGEVGRGATFFFSLPANG